MTNEQIDLLVCHINHTIGTDPEQWVERPLGYPDQIEAALLDSVFSLRAVYGQSSSKGPRAVVQRWKQHVMRPLNNLRALVDDVDQLGGPKEFQRVLKHDGVAVPNAVDKPTKALAVYDTAKALVGIEVFTAEDAIRERYERPKKLLRAIQAGRGVGPQAATYFLMNLGVPGVKADVMIKRFVEEALSAKVTDLYATELVVSAADHLAADVIRLDHAIWKHGSDLGRTTRRRKPGG